MEFQTELKNILTSITQSKGVAKQFDQSLVRMREKQLHEALVDAFTKDTMERLLHFELDIRLDTISLGTDTMTLFFDVIRDLARSGRIDDLISAAFKANSGNKRLHAFVSEFYPQLLQ